MERTARGRADAKAKGVKFGRKPTLTPHQQREAIKRRDVDGETLRSIARSYNVSPQTISRLGRMKGPAARSPEELKFERRTDETAPSTDPFKG